MAEWQAGLRCAECARRAGVDVVREQFRACERCGEYFCPMCYVGDELECQGCVEKKLAVRSINENTGRAFQHATVDLVLESREFLASSGEAQAMCNEIANQIRRGQAAQASPKSIADQITLLVMGMYRTLPALRAEAERGAT